MVFVLLFIKSCAYKLFGRKDRIERIEGSNMFVEKNVIFLFGIS